MRVDVDGFWAIVERHRGDAEAVTAALVKLPAAEIEAWNRIYHELHARLHHWDLWGAAYVINGGCSDDGFHYFKAWVIGKGRRVYQTALTAPDELGPFVTEQDQESGCENEDLNYSADKAYEEQGGAQGALSHPSNESSDPRGQPWDETELAGRLPQLSKRFSA